MIYMISVAYSTPWPLHRKLTVWSWKAGVRRRVNYHDCPYHKKFCHPRKMSTGDSFFVSAALLMRIILFTPGNTARNFKCWPFSASILMTFGWRINEPSSCRYVHCRLLLSGWSSDSLRCGKLLHGGIVCPATMLIWNIPHMSRLFIEIELRILCAWEVFYWAGVRIRKPMSVMFER